MDKISFADLVDLKALKSMQDSFSKYTGLAMIVSDSEGSPVLEGSGGSEFCWKYTCGTKLGAQRCAECDRYGAHLAYSQNKAVYYTCHAGMTDFVIPICFENRIVGTIIAGQVRSDDFDIEKAREIAAEIGVDPDEYAAAAMRANYMSKQDAEDTALFLSEFAESLSIMAHTNYVKNKELEKAERLARSQSGFITGLTVDLRKTMRGWLDSFRAATAKYDAIPEIKRETDELLSKGQEVYSVIGGAVDYIKMSSGEVDYAEGVYDIRELINNNIDSLKKEYEDAEAELKAVFDDSLPETLAGNSGKIGQIVRTIGSSVMGFTNKGGEVELSVSCDKTKYSCNLIIKVIGTGTRMTDKAGEAIESIIENGGCDIFSNENITPRDANFPLVVLLLKQMSGSICAEKLENGNVVFRITVPQLDGAKQKV